MADYTPEQWDAMTPRERWVADTLHAAAEGHTLDGEQRQWLAAEVVRLRAERDEARGTRDEALRWYRYAIGVPVSEHQARRLETMAQRVESLSATVDRVRSLAEGPTSDRYRPYAVEVDGEVHLAVLLDNVRAALDGEVGQ